MVISDGYTRSCLVYAEPVHSILDGVATLRSRNYQTAKEEVMRTFIARNLLSIATAPRVLQAGEAPPHISLVSAPALVRKFPCLAPALAPANLPELFRQTIRDIVNKHRRRPPAPHLSPGCKGKPSRHSRDRRIKSEV